MPIEIPIGIYLISAPTPAKINAFQLCPRKKKYRLTSMNKTTTASKWPFHAASIMVTGTKRYAADAMSP